MGLTLALTGAGGGIVALPLLVFALNLEKDAGDFRQQFDVTS